MTKSRSAFALFLLLAIFGLTVCSSEPTAPERDSADLSITKSDEADPVSIGDEIVYTITVFNGGPDGATQVQLTDAVPSGTSFVSANASQGTCANSSGTVTCTIGSLANAGTATITLRVTANQGGQVTNTASVTGDEDDPNAANNSETETTTVELDPADLIYTITVKNDGPGHATDVQVTDDVPEGTTFVSADASQGSCSDVGGTVTCDLGSLADGATATITLTVGTEEAGLVENTATVSANEPDPDEGDNSDTEITNVVSVTTDLAITKVAERDPVAPGEDIVYVIGVRNRGPNDAGAVRVTDDTPVGTTFISADPSQGECGEESGTVTCNLGGLERLHDATVTLTVEAGEAGQVINTAMVSGGVQDTVEDNNSATDTTTVTPLADLSVDKDDEADPVEVGENIIYTLVVTNLGPNTATEVVVTDSLPDTTDFDDVTTTAGLCDERRNVVTCDVAQLATGDTVRISIETTTEQVGFVNNRVSVTSSVLDPDQENNSDRAGTNVTGLVADLSITKSALANPVTVGTNIVYDIIVFNNGPDDVTNVTVTDVVPAETTYISAAVNPGTCGFGGGVVTCDIPTLPSGVGTVITLTLRADQVVDVTNTATVSPPPDAEDPVAGNDSDSETVTVNP
jgi:uncharacterized repeat protein (TIGR01451 family)